MDKCEESRVESRVRDLATQELALEMRLSVCEISPQLWSVARLEIRILENCCPDLHLSSRRASRHALPTLGPGTWRTTRLIHASGR